ncbi:MULTISPECIES: alpha-hydroxy-acid oxidizing protein [unclassified Dietzia]|uniref:alpha-hydroxy-acid oxidizing protein n=1 Tax=unclassified Dietzia TaxID=2617939 RepID=UPI000D21A57F|nr:MULTISPECIES: alpha-hydroxy-acid oxidizing protein [unclassified Dietzia]AVZ39897.1 lactate 2-monooxygenase [Dietzia sp. JS16-p6b]QGW25291.1 dehydrogenase [Dietzia sp. DQ12-45-1b]
MTSDSLTEPENIAPGRARQNTIYRAGVSGITPSVPTSADTLEAAARRALLRRPGGRRAWAYVYGGAGSGETMSANREALDRRRLVPRVLRSTEQRDLSTEVLGQSLPAPVLVAPIGAAGLVRRDADVHIGRAAAERRLPYILSSQGSSPMEATAAAMKDAPRWFQLYWSRDEQLVDSFISRAEAAGAGALVVTLDTTTLGWRPWDLDLGSLPFTRGVGIAQYTSDPRFVEMVAERVAQEADPGSGPEPEAVKVTPRAVVTLLEMARNHPGGFRRNLSAPETRAAVQTFLDTFSNPALNWDHIATLRDRTRLPVVLKGVLHPDDARRALDMGVDAVMVSNHGGRQVDGSIGTLDALVRIREAVGPEPTLLLDSGIRNGTDVVKAMACGADAVTIGRPHIYGLAIAGQKGVGEVLDNLLAEIDLTLSLCGASSWDDVDGSLLA